MDAKIAIIGYGSMGRMIFEKTLAKRKVTTEKAIQLLQESGKRDKYD